MTNLDRTPTLPQADELTTALRAVLDAWASPFGDHQGSSPRLPPRLTVAFSGGLDSTVLLAALCRLGLAASVRAVHVDHGLHPESAQWSAHCAATAAAFGAEFAAVRVAVDRASRQGLEAAAREVRYRALGELLAPGEWLLTAHHGDDQLETLLLRLLRGTGVRGLRGIIAFGPFAAGSLGRPLLKFTREQLRAQALAWNLPWLEDPSNREPRHDRNYLRLQVLPALLARWPEAAHSAERLAEQMTRGGAAARCGGGRGRGGAGRALARAAGGARGARARAAAQPVAAFAAASSASGRQARASSRSCAPRCSGRIRIRTRSCSGRVAKAACSASALSWCAAAAGFAARLFLARRRRRLDGPRRSSRARAAEPTVCRSRGLPRA